MSAELTPQDGTNPDEELELELEDLDDTEDVETLREQLTKEREARKQILARAKKAEEALKKQPKAEPHKTNSHEAKPSGYDILNDEVADLLMAGHTKEDVKFIMANGGVKALEDANSLVAIAINTKREQRKAEQAASQTTSSGVASEVERKYTPEQLKNMPLDKLKEILPKA
jgi:hypothetical protein